MRPSQQPVPNAFTLAVFLGQRLRERFTEAHAGRVACPRCRGALSLRYDRHGPYFCCLCTTARKAA